ncbi:hypothetical protein GmRootV35_54060 [Variovorax sp. V35]
MGLSMSQTQLHKFGTKGGTGFAFEDLNTLQDRRAGHAAEQVGHTNQLNGPDRVVDGIAIQSKCFDSARRTVLSAFDERGTYRYGTQQLEVPRDQVLEARDLMRKQILSGKVPGVSDPKEAENMIRGSSYTYEQVANTAKAGTIDSLRFDVTSGAVVCLCVAGFAACIDYAQVRWSGASEKEALRSMTRTAMDSGSAAMASYVVAAQLVRTTLWRKARIGIRHGVKALAKTGKGRTMVEAIARASSRTPMLGGAAVTQCTKVLSHTGAAAMATTVVTTVPDIYRAAFTKRGSWAQAGKSLVCNGAQVTGGSVGWVTGAAVGAAYGSVLPGAGNVVGAVVGGLVGSLSLSTALGSGARWAMGHVVKDDAAEMLEIVLPLISEVSDAYLLTELEQAALVEQLPMLFPTPTLRDMYASHERHTFATQVLESAALGLTAARAPIVVPDAKDLDHRDGGDPASNDSMPFRKSA